MLGTTAAGCSLGDKVRDRHWRCLRVRRRSRVRATDEFGRVDIFEKVEAAKPSLDQLRALAGNYINDEIETTLSVVVDGDALVIKRRPDTRIALRPIYPDAFNGGGLGTVIFRRGSDGQVSGLSVSQDRVWDLRFAREVKPAATAGDRRRAA